MPWQLRALFTYGKKISAHIWYISHLIRCWNTNVHVRSTQMSQDILELHVLVWLNKAMPIHVFIQNTPHIISILL